MNSARLFRRIKRDLGLTGMALPIDNLDTYMKEILEDTTIPVFSIYQPRYEIITVDTNEFVRGDYDRGETCDLYLLPMRIFEGREVLYLRAIDYASDSMNYYTRYPGAMVTPGNGNILENLLLANAEKPFLDEAVNRITFHYEYPRKVYIYDALLSSRLRLTLACEHDTSLQSLPPTAGESFYNLGLLDIEAALWKLVKDHEEIGGAYDRITLKVEEWQNAKAARLDLLKEWDEVYMLDQDNYDFG